MATPDPLEKLFTSEVDESEISALVGSLESQLASPTIKEAAGQNSTQPVLSNHVEVSRVTTPVSSHLSLTTTAPVKVGVLQSNAEISANAPNGSNNHVQNNQTVDANSISTNAMTQSGHSPAVHVLSTGVNSLQAVTTGNVASPSNNAQPTVKYTAISNSAFVSQPGAGAAPNPVFVTVGSTNAGTVVLASTQNSLNPVTINTTVSQQGILPNHTVQSGSSVQGPVSAIHSLASVAAAQAPLSIPNTSLAPGPNGTTARINVQQTDSTSVVAPVSNNTINVPRPKIVMQGKPTELRMVTQTLPQTIASVTQQQQPQQPQQTLNVSTVKVPNANPANSNVITLANKPAAQTVAVVRPTTQPQVQIVNRIPVSGAAQPRVLAPRTIATSIRIAPQQPARPTQQVRKSSCVLRCCCVNHTEVC